MPNCGQARTPVTPSIYLARDQTPFILANFFPLCSSSCTLASHTSHETSTCRLILKIETLSWIFSQTNSRPGAAVPHRSEEHTSELQSQSNLVCRLLLEKK